MTVGHQNLVDPAPLFDDNASPACRVRVGGDYRSRVDLGVELAVDGTFGRDLDRWKATSNRIRVEHLDWCSATGGVLRHGFEPCAVVVGVGDVEASGLQIVERLR